MQDSNLRLLAPEATETDKPTDDKEHLTTNFTAVTVSSTRLCTTVRAARSEKKLRKKPTK